MELALVILAATSPFIALAWWTDNEDNEDKRRHERRMKKLEIERLKQAAKNSVWKAMKEDQP